MLTKKIFWVSWSNKIYSVDFQKKTNCKSAVLEIRLRQLRLLGHVLEMGKQSTPKVALRWTPSGRRKPVRPNTRWLKTVMDLSIEDRISATYPYHIPMFLRGILLMTEKAVHQSIQ